jgi:hypothetical protein
MTINRAWVVHTLGGLIASGAVFGLVEAFVPAGYKAQAYAVLPTVAYLLGVALPTPVKQ